MEYLHGKLSMKAYNKQVSIPKWLPISTIQDHNKMTDFAILY